jgi:leucine rich repeat domain protein
MRKRFYTLLALSLLSTAILLVGCNKDKIDFGGGSDPNSISQVTTGNGAPTAGQKGNYYFDSTSKTLYKKKGSSWTGIATMNLNGDLLSGQGKAKPSQGNNGDSYIDTKTNTIYEKKNGVWSASSEGEIVIKDANFKAALLAIVGIDANKNGKISPAEAQAITGFSVAGKEIASLEGIEAFTNLESLDANDNKLTTVDLSKLTHLKKLNLTNNLLSGELNLKELKYLANDKVKIVAGNASIEKIFVADEAKATALNNFEHTTKYTFSGELERILDLDPVIKAALLADNNRPDRNGDGEITNKEAERFNKPISIIATGIQSLKGIEYFKKATSLVIQAPAGQTNNLTTGNGVVSLADFTEIESLTIANTKMTKLTLSNFPKLKHLILTGNELTEVVLSGMPELVILNLERNNLTNLNGITTPENTFPKLTTLNLIGNNLQGELDLSKITANLRDNANTIQILRRNNNSGVVRIKVKDQDTANALNTNDAGAGKYQVDGSGGSNPVINIPDSAFRRYILQRLKGGIIGKSALMDLNTFRGRFPGDINDTTSPIYQSDLDLFTDDIKLENGTGITNLGGLQYFRKLKKVIIEATTATSLDLTGLEKLERIEISGTSLQILSGSGVNLKRVTLRNALSMKKLNLHNFQNIEQVLIVEDSNQPDHIECIAVPASKVDAIKNGINMTGNNGPAKTTAYRSKVQSTPCN